MDKKSAIIFIILEIILLIVYATTTKYHIKEVPDAATTYYKMFQDVNVMIFIGFGFLMTFLKTHSWSAVSFNFLVSAWTLQIGILFLGMWEHIFCKEKCEDYIHVDITMLIRGLFAAGAVMISFGAVLGKVTGFQLVIMAIFEMFFYALNEAIGVIEIKAIDMGGSMFVHMFGAFFGVGVAKVYSPKNAQKSRHCGDNYSSNLFGMIGTIFLWMYWPSFNGALATGDQEHRVILNTVFALTGSCLMTFIISALCNDGKFKMEDILNASLAGGVIIGTSSDLCQNPSSAIGIGAFGGLVSTLMYNKLSPILQEKNILHDTCGVLNLHGVPGILGGLIGAVNVRISNENTFTIPLIEAIAPREDRSAQEQAGMQVVAVVVTFLIALVSGMLTGLIMKMKVFNQPLQLDDLFNDKYHWVMEEEEEDVKSEYKQSALDTEPRDVGAPIQITNEH